MTISRTSRWPVLRLVSLFVTGCATPAKHLRINQIQFVGSHNSYKQAMSADHFHALRARNPQAALALEYSHQPIQQQLSLGIRKLELDVFNDPASNQFTVGHVQQIDMHSHCTPLQECLRQIVAWSDQNANHVPLWISFNLKDQIIEGLPEPTPFDADALRRLDRVLVSQLGNRMIRPADVWATHAPPQWPRLSQARGKMLLVLDEGGAKRGMYEENWRQRPMFMSVAEQHPAAAVMIINDPLISFDAIQAAVRAGYMVRTRADADTVEARSNDTRRRDAAFASGAQAISTDYYLPADHFTGREAPAYQVTPQLRCNPLNTQPGCTVTE